MANFGKALEAAITRINKKQVAPALRELRATMKRLQKALDKQRRAVAARLGKGKAGAGSRRARTDDGPTMSPKEVAALRQRMGMSQAAFARAAGVTHVSVYFWESGKTKPRGERLARLRQLEAQSGRAGAAKAVAAKRGSKKTTTATPKKSGRKVVSRTAAGGTRTAAGRARKG